MTGRRHSKDGYGRAQYWKNGTEYVLQSNAVQTYVSDIVVVDGDVYVTGTEYNNTGEEVPVLWKNGEATYPTKGIAGTVAGLYVTAEKPEEDSEYIEPDGNRTGNCLFIDASPAVDFEITLNGETKKTRDSHDVEKYGLPDCRTDIPSGIIHATPIFTNLPYGKYTVRVISTVYRPDGTQKETRTFSITVDRYCRTFSL